ncbi:MAG: TRAM domain-containing protein [Clostridiales bacterium]|nr:TRAM domain-containing protein [Clostridiales bacterium]
MMRSKQMQRLLRILVMGAGAGAGAAVAFGCVQVYRMTTALTMPLGLLVLLYCGLGAAGMLAGWLAAPRIVKWCGEWMESVERQLDALSTAQLASMSAGLITGLLIAALLTQVLNYLGDSIFTLAASAVMYVVLGATGVSIGKRRTEDFSELLSSKEPRRERRAKQQNDAAALKVLDSSVLIDGRLEAVLKTGFLEGEMLIPDFVLAEMQSMADSAEEAKRIRGRRGLDAVKRLQEDPAVRLRVEDTGDLSLQDADVRLMALARDMDAALMTGDFNLNRAARVIGVRVLNLNDLAVALRQVTAAGDVLSVRVTKEGREAGQGVGYLEDGTMIVIEGGRECVGQTVRVTVTSVLQTSAGRMVFAKRSAQEDK